MREYQTFDVVLVRPSTNSVLRASIKAKDYDCAVGEALRGMTGWVVETSRKPY